jgi:IclR family transcriptional regulator, pca regulon regulatory protein
MWDDPPTMHRPDAEPVHGAELVQSLERGLALIRAFDPAPRLTMSQVAPRTGLTSAGARRLLFTFSVKGQRYARRRPRARRLPHWPG